MRYNTWKTSTAWPPTTSTSSNTNWPSKTHAKYTNRYTTQTKITVQHPAISRKDRTNQSKATTQPHRLGRIKIDIVRKTALGARTTTPITSKSNLTRNIQHGRILPRRMGHFKIFLFQWDGRRGNALQNAERWYSTQRRSKKLVEVRVENQLFDLTCRKPFTGCLNANLYTSFCSGG